MVQKSITSVGVSMPSKTVAATFVVTIALSLVSLVSVPQVAAQIPGTSSDLKLPDPNIKLPAAGPVEIFPLAKLRPGMMGTGFTAFEGNTPEPFPVEIIGVLKNQWG